jgi:hypothetical protein
MYHHNGGFAMRVCQPPIKVGTKLPFDGVRAKKEDTAHHLCVSLFWGAGPSSTVTHMIAILLNPPPAGPPDDCLHPTSCC